MLLFGECYPILTNILHSDHRSLSCIHSNFVRHFLFQSSQMPEHRVDSLLQIAWFSTCWCKTTQAQWWVAIHLPPAWVRYRLWQSLFYQAAKSLPLQPEIRRRKKWKTEFKRKRQYNLQKMRSWNKLYLKWRYLGLLYLFHQWNKNHLSGYFWVYS